jgi:microcystin-dependent protein
MRGATTEEATVDTATISGSDLIVTITGSNVPDSIAADGVDVYFAKTLDPSAFVPAVSVGDVRLTSGPVDQAGTGWLVCDGGEYAVADYPALAALYGATGIQDGCYDNNPRRAAPAGNNFLVPDLRGRVPLGWWSDVDQDPEPNSDYYNYEDGGTVNPNKTYYGKKTHEITEDEMPAHDHDGVTGSDGGHTHTLDLSTTGTGNPITTQRGGGSIADTGTGVSSEPNHTHTIASKGDAANNSLDLRQLSLVMGYVVFAGV